MSEEAKRQAEETESPFDTAITAINGSNHPLSDRYRKSNTATITPGVNPSPTGKSQLYGRRTRATRWQNKRKSLDVEDPFSSGDEDQLMPLRRSKRNKGNVSFRFHQIEVLLEKLNIPPIIIPAQIYVMKLRL